MRFIENGPILPTELLTARDEGQVVFFCGSGVSLARARLPDFYGLADAVLDELRASPNSRARAVIAASRSIKVKGVEGLIPADRAFSLLEQEFDASRVRAAVAASLKPKTMDLAAHQALLELARGTDNEVRLVTTNFDRLFQACDPKVDWHAPPDLPHPGRASQFKGIFHLHGVLDDDGKAPENEEFVISSADFGRAYLSDGWATRFIRALMERYQIVFVGYTANDPPVQYLLEALNTRSATFQPMYALQAGDDDLAKAMWLHKGVQPIAFNPANNYQALWDTIFAWAERARDPSAWIAGQIARAANGPQPLKPHERGIIAHIASHTAGARQIAKAGAALPGEWLCVFDREMRFRTPAPRIPYNGKDVFDPFAAWGLDDDITPKPVDPGNLYGERKIPAEAADMLQLRRFEDDTSRPSPQNPVGLTFGDSNVLPERLRLLSSWVVAVAHEPVTLWWAAGKGQLHPHVTDWLRRALTQEVQRFPAEIRRGWRRLFESRSQPSDQHGMEFYALEEAIKADGWSASFVRRLVALRAPRLDIRRSRSRGAPPEGTAPDDLLFAEIRYPNAAIDFEVPPESMPLYARELGQAVERAIDMEFELRQGIYILGPLTPEVDPDGRVDSGDDLTGLIRSWIAGLEAVLQIDPIIVRSELPRWQSRTDPVSTRLKIWSSGAEGLFSEREAAEQLLALDDEGFWDREQQRDLLQILARRWSSLRPADRRKLERRLRTGPKTYDGETPAMHRMRAAARALERLFWLHAQGCSFSFDYAEEVARLTRRYPDWNAQAGEVAADSTEPRAYTVGEQTDYDDLLDIPVALVAEAATAADHQRIDIQTVRRPFLGLAKDRPVRALAALRRTNAVPSVRLWEDFLCVERPTPLSPAMLIATACVLADLPTAGLADISRPVARWIETEGARLSVTDASSEARLWEQLLAALEAFPEKAGSAVLTSADGHDWLLEAINSPTGRLAAVAVHRASQDAPQGDLPTAWLVRLARLIRIQGDPGRYAIVTATQNLSFLHLRAPDFSKEYLLSARMAESEDRAAFWTGVYRAQGLSVDLHRILNADILFAAVDGGSGRAETNSLSALLLRGWAMVPLRESGGAITSDELRETLLLTTDSFRCQILQTTRRWWGSEGWPDRAVELLQSVWPRQRSARSAATVDAIASLVVESDARFPELMAAARDLLEPLPGMGSMWSYDVARLTSLIERFPGDMLDFLYRVLPEDAANWPYRAELLLEPMEATAFSKDHRLQDLRRRWSARNG